MVAGGGHHLAVFELAGGDEDRQQVKDEEIDARRSGAIQIGRRASPSWLRVGELFTLWLLAGLGAVRDIGHTRQPNDGVHSSSR